MPDAASECLGLIQRQFFATNGSGTAAGGLKKECFFAPPGKPAHKADAFWSAKKDQFEAQIKDVTIAPVDIAI